jgi:large subunit ribosomal protein L3
MVAKSNLRKRTGLLMQKVGMTSYFNQEGLVIPATVLKLHPTTVLAHKTVEKDGHAAVALVTGPSMKADRCPKPQRVVFEKASIEPRAHIKEFIVSSDAYVPVGSSLSVEHFVPGQRVDVRGLTIGKGFAGVMKRWGFGGLRASHGVSITHRSHGSTGQRQDPGKVFKNKKMAGHMGHSTVSVQNLVVLDVDKEHQLLLVRGAIPGPKTGWIAVTDAVKHMIASNVPYPAGLLDNQSLERDGVQSGE